MSRNRDIIPFSLRAFFEKGGTFVVLLSAFLLWIPWGIRWFPRSKTSTSISVFSLEPLLPRMKSWWTQNPGKNSVNRFSQFVRQLSWPLWRLIGVTGITSLSHGASCRNKHCNLRLVYVRSYTEDWTNSNLHSTQSELLPWISRLFSYTKMNEVHVMLSFPAHPLLGGEKPWERGCA